MQGAVTAKKDALAAEKDAKSLLRDALKSEEKLKSQLKLTQLNLHETKL